MCMGCGTSIAPPNTQYQQPEMQYQQPGPQYQQPGPQYQQPGPQYQQPRQQTAPAGPNVGLVETLKSQPIRICTLVALFFFFLTSWLPAWVTSNGSGGGLFSGGGGVLILWGIVIILVVAWTFLVEFMPNIQAISGIVSSYKQLPFYQFYAPGVFLILFFLIIFNSMVRIATIVGSYGFCFYLYIIAFILILVEPVMGMVNANKRM